MGVVFQAYNLFPHLSVLDNLTLAPRKVHGVDRATAEAQGAELLDRFGLADKADEHPDRLSGGQQQRVAMVRALATEPALLLLDEVTAALDPELIGEVLEIIRRLAARARRWCWRPTRWRSPATSRPRCASSTTARVLEQGPPARSSPRPARSGRSSSPAGVVR